MDKSVNIRLGMIALVIFAILALAYFGNVVGKYSGVDTVTPATALDGDEPPAAASSATTVPGDTTPDPLP